MSTKLGRPPVPKDKAKTEFLGVFVDPQESQRIHRAIAESGMKKSDWTREALLTRARPLWLICKKWGADDLHGKTVEFNLEAKNGKNFIRGLGRFWVLKHKDGIRLAIEIHATKLGITDSSDLRIFLDQKLAELIEKHSDRRVAEFRLFSVVSGVRDLG
jgi:hypothetical protein